MKTEAATPIKLKPLHTKTDKNYRTTSQNSSLSHSLVSEEEKCAENDSEQLLEKVTLNRQSMRSVRKETFGHMFGLKQ